MNKRSNAARAAHRAGLLLALAALAAGCKKDGDGGAASDQATERLGTAAEPLVVMLIPSETGSSSVLDDYGPLFAAITRTRGLHFDLKLGDSYNAVVEGMAAGHIDVAFFGPVTFDEARRRGVAELLAVEETDGQSIYFAGFYHRADSGMQALTDLKGKAIAVGDPKSTSSFAYPLAMLLDAGIDPARDLSGIVMAGSHSASLERLAAGHVDAAAASINAFDKMVAAGTIDPARITLLARSDAIPSPPIAMRAGLPPAVKAELKSAFSTIHEAEGVTAEMLLGYGGKKVDRYDAAFDAATFDRAMARLARVTDELISEVIDKAGQQ